MGQGAYISSSFLVTHVFNSAARPSETSIMVSPMLQGSTYPATIQNLLSTVSSHRVAAMQLKEVEV